MDPSRRLHRLLRLILLLQSGQAKLPSDLVRELGVSRRTLFRDLKTLQETGIPCANRRGEGYGIAGSYFLPPVNLTILEALGLLLMGKIVSAKREQPLMGPARSALVKLLAGIPSSLREACDELMRPVSVAAGPRLHSDAESPHFGRLQRCIDEGRACRVIYQGPIDDRFETQFEPYALHFCDRAWYAFGRTAKHDEVRMLKLVRIELLQPLTVRFDKPKRFTPADKLGEAWGYIPEGRLYDVELEFKRKVATNVSEVRWHPSQQTTLLPDGRCRMKFRVDGVNEISWWVCGYADQVCVIAPGELRALVRDRLRAAAAQYEGPIPHEAIPSGQ